MKLRTIGSAPKDGTRIVLFEANEGKVYNCFSGFWNRGEWSHDGAYELRFSHWCPLPTLEDDAETCRSCEYQAKMGITLLDAKWLDPACHKGCRSLSFTAELQAVKAERDALRAALEGVTTKAISSIGEQLRTQDNRCTANPMFIVQEQRSFGCEPGEGDKNIWLDGDWEEADEETSAQLDELNDAFEWELEEEQVAMLKRYTKRGIKHFWEFCMASFTEQGCKRYIELDGHNLTKPRIYAMSWNRCPEMLEVRKFLMAIPTPEESPVDGRAE